MKKCDFMVFVEKEQNKISLEIRKNLGLNILGQESKKIFSFNLGNLSL